MQKRRRKKRPLPTPESRAADFCTIGWLLSALMALFCGTLSLAAGWYAGDLRERFGLRMFSDYLLLAAFVTGLFGLALTAAVWKARRVPPPPGVTIFAVVVCAAPVMAVLLRQFQ